MKNKFILLLLLAAIGLPFGGFSQEYVPFPDSNATWIVYSMDSYNMHHYQYFVAPTLEDTIIEGVQYTKVFRNYTGWPWNKQLKNGQPNESIQHTKDEIYGPSYYGAFRNTTDGKVFYLAHEDLEFTSEQLLFDFSKNEGDTIRDVFIEIVSNLHFLIDYVVDSVTYKDFGPHHRKCLFLSPLSSDFPCYDSSPDHEGSCYLVWIEGLGSFNNGGIINHVSSGFEVIDFRCMTQNDTLYYRNHTEQALDSNLVYESGVCLLPVGINDWHVDKTPLLISPNPVGTYFRIENLADDHYEISFYNTLVSYQ